MVRIGKVVGNLMVDLNPSNVKLRDRAARIVAELTGCGYEENGWHIGENRHRLMPILSDGSLGRISSAANIVGNLKNCVDVDAALKWVDDIPDEKVQKRAQKAVLDAWAKRDIQAAAAHTASLPIGEEKDLLLRDLAYRFVGLSPESAVDWAATLPLADQQSIGPTMIKHWAYQDPVAAAGYVAGLDPGALRAEALEEVVTAWSNTDPKSAVEWVERFPESPMRDVTLATSIKAWSRVVPALAAEYVKKFPKGKTRDGLVVAHASSIVFFDPQSASTWVNEIQDEALRTGLVEQIAQRWLLTDFPAGVAWIKSGVVSPEVRARLLQSAERNK